MPTWSGWGLCSGLQISPFTLCGRKDRDLSGASFVKAWILFMSVPPLWSNHPQISSPLGLRSLTYEFLGDRIHTTAEYLTSPRSQEQSYMHSHVVICHLMLHFYRILATCQELGFRKAKVGFVPESQGTLLWFSSTHWSISMIQSTWCHHFNKSVWYPVECPGSTDIFRIWQREN